MQKLTIRKRSHRKRRIFISIIVVIILVGIGYGIFRALPDLNSKVEPPKLAKAGHSERKPTKKEQVKYEVAPGLPRALYIDKIGINEAKILPMGLETNGALASPDSIYDVGWYKDSALPGSGTGAILLDGHVSGVNDPNAIFHRLKELKAGDKITVEKGDKSKVVYTVRETEQKPIEKVDMAKMMRSVDPELEGLNLITCGGTYNYARQIYEDRIMVYAVREV